MLVAERDPPQLSRQAEKVPTAPPPLTDNVSVSGFIARLRLARKALDFFQLSYRTPGVLEQVALDLLLAPAGLCHKPPVLAGENDNEVLLTGNIH